MEHNPIIPFVLALALIILGARISGSLARRIGQPRVLGELIAGLILGPTLLNMPHWAILGHIELVEMLKPFSELGVLFLMFMIGLEVELSELIKVGRVALLAGFAGALLPVALTVPVGLYFGFGLDVSLFAGVALSATSVSISAQVLLELGHLRSKEGNALLATAIIDDVLAILLVSLTLVFIGGPGTESGGAGSVLIIVIRMIAYLGIALAISWYVIPRIINRAGRYSEIAQSYGISAMAIIFMLLFSWSAEQFGGVAMITGAFIAGLGMSRARDHLKHDIETTSSNIAYAFLLPVFFISVGLEVDLSTFPLSATPLALALLLVAVVSKVGGSGLGALFGGFTPTESLRVGVCMISRGEVGLIIATLGLSAGVLTSDSPLFASLFFVILLTTIVTPVLVRQVFPKN